YIHQGFAWVSGTSASLPFSLPTTPGTYVFRYWQNCSTQIAVSPTVAVQSAGALSLTVNGNGSAISLAPGSVVNVGVQNGPGTADCVTLTSTADYIHQGFAWVSGTSASLPFSLPATPGTYVFRYWPLRDALPVLSPTVAVQSAGALSLTVNGSGSAISLAPGSVVNVGVQNGPGTADCVTLTGIADFTHQGFAWVSSTSASLP